MVVARVQRDQQCFV
jgi:CTP:molybdopterin cytidylyltransferase MocA